MYMSESVQEAASVEIAEKPVKEKLIKRIFKGILRPFKFIKRKTEPARDFLRKGRSGAMVLEIILAGQFFAEVFREMVLQKIPFVLCLLISTALLAAIAELLNLVVKLILGGGKRCKSYFLTALLSVFMINIIADQGEAVPPAILMSFALVLAVDVVGRVIWGFIRTRRFKQVTAYVAVALSIAYIVLFAMFYHNDNLGSSRLDFYNGIEGEMSSTVPGFSSYLQDGSYNVATLSYGPGEDEDIVTDTLDLTIFEGMDEAEDPLTALTWAASDMDYAASPVKGRIWYPEGGKNCPVFFMVHGNHVSTEPSYLGYEYLGTYLASNGYVVVSVDENIINELGAGNNIRAYLLLENMKTIFGLSESSGNPLSGLIDQERVVIGGHSRGGEMVATAYLFNDLDCYPEDGNIKFDYHFNISGIVAIAPVVDQYMPLGRAVEITDVNYLLIHGSNDQDVSIMMGEKQYNNVTFTGEGDEEYFKSSVYILGANHGQFNSRWGRYDTTIGDGYLNTNNFLDEADQKLIAKAYIRTFLDKTLLGDDTYFPLLSDVSSYAGDLPDTIYITNYESSDARVLCSFEDVVNIGDCGNGTTLSVSGSSKWTLSPYVRGNGGADEDYVLDVSWDEDPDVSVDVTFEPVDISNGYISFCIADMSEEGNEDIDSVYPYAVELTDASGNKVSAEAPVLVFRTLAVQLYKQDVLSGSYEYKHQLQTVRISPDVFGDSDFDYSAVTGISITYTGDGQGEMIIDNIAYMY